MAKGYQKRNRASKYEKKLAIDASFEDVIKIALGMKPTTPTSLHFSKSQGTIQFELKGITGIAFEFIQIFKGILERLQLTVEFVYATNPGYQESVDIREGVRTLPTENPPILPIITGFISDRGASNKGVINKIVVKCHNEDDFDFLIWYSTR